MSKDNRPKLLLYLTLFFSFVFILGSIFLICAQEKFIYDSGGRRNPFIPLITPDGRLVQLDATQDKRSGDILLEGIIYDQGGASFAVVNSAVVKVGDDVEGYEVISIEKNKVVLKKNNELKEFRLHVAGYENGEDQK